MEEHPEDSSLERVEDDDENELEDNEQSAEL